MVRNRRMALGLTLADLAEAVGLTANYLQTVEAGARDVSLSTIEAVAVGLGMIPGELLGDTERLTPEALEAGRLLDSLAPEARDSVLTLLRLLAASHPATPVRASNPVTERPALRRQTPRRPRKA
jgi:transcriptional regulator with XRE-family HTH domain